ncbi:ribosome modulation factor [Pseudomonas typographi]|uniref:ribosome modulation factor n=1 Tax=Pseudomonas typographi TaxID=2715964 RepID=UPI003B836C9C
MAYYNGRAARRQNTSKLACPFTPVTYLGSWWLAGWNDMDIELETQTRAAPPAPDTGPIAA